MDLGVIMDKSSTPSRQCAHVRSRSYLTVGTIRMKIVSRVNDTILRLYLGDFFIILETGNHCYKQDMEKLKKARKRAKRF